MKDQKLKLRNLRVSENESKKKGKKKKSNSTRNRGLFLGGMAIADGVAQGVVIIRGHGGSRHVSIRAIRLGFCIVALASCLAIARLVSVDSVAQRSILSPASEAARWLMGQRYC